MLAATGRPLAPASSIHLLHGRLSGCAPSGRRPGASPLRRLQDRQHYILQLLLLLLVLVLLGALVLVEPSERAGDGVGGGLGVGFGQLGLESFVGEGVAQRVDVRL